MTIIRRLSVLVPGVFAACSTASHRSAESTEADTTVARTPAGAVASVACLGLGRVDLWPDTSMNIQPTGARLQDPRVPQVTGRRLSSDASTGQIWGAITGEFDAPPNTFFAPEDTFTLDTDNTEYRWKRAPRNGQPVPDVVNRCLPVEGFNPQQAHENMSATKAQWDAMPAAVDPATSSDWVLTFHDEFDGTTLGPQWNTHYFRSTAFTSLDNGILQLSVDGNRPDFAFGETRVSSITTQNSFSQKYGWFEIRAKLPEGSGVSGTGLASSFWTQVADPAYNELSFNGGTRNNGWESYEIDLFEDNSYTSHAGASADDISHLSQARFFDFPFVLSDAFHVYAMEWSPTLVTWYVDGKVVFTSVLVPQSPMWFLIELRSGSGVPTPPETFDHGPRSIDVDYFRAYARAGAPG